MSFNFFIATLCFVLPFLKFYANAAALKRDVFDPPITYPTQGTVWHVGETHNVTWDTSILPPNLNQTGMIVLGFLNNTANDDNEHLDLDNPLATGFQLAAGKVDITVPAVPPMDSYILILFGDSGNASPEFTITGLSIGMTSSSSSAIPTATTPASESAPTSASSLVDGSSSTIVASSPEHSSSSAFTLASNPAANNNNSPVPSSASSTIALAVSTSPVNTASPAVIPSSSSTSPSPSTPAAADGSTNGIAQSNSAQAKSISFTVLSFSATTAVFLLWV